MRSDDPYDPKPKDIVYYRGNGGEVTPRIPETIHPQVIQAARAALTAWWMEQVNSMVGGKPTKKARQAVAARVERQLIHIWPGLRRKERAA
jgi:hypothetical protein